MNKIRKKPVPQQLHHIDWFNKYGINTFDLGMLSRANGKMKNNIKDNKESVQKLLKFARYLNASEQTDIFIRPHKNGQWNMIFVDDVDIKLACSFASTYTCLLVNTSHEGGCQIWVPTAVKLSQKERYTWQKNLISLLNADPGSVSGEHYGRLAGFCNHKRQKQWSNLYAENEGMLWHPNAPIVKSIHKPTLLNNTHKSGTDDSESAKEFGFACYSLSNNVPESQIIDNIEKRAAARGKKTPTSYAQRTVQKAKETLCNRSQS
ncbi:MAG: DNA-primase RepB domain-containing protein [Mariprofundaceae bacterium]